MHGYVCKCVQRQTEDSSYATYTFLFLMHFLLVIGLAELCGPSSVQVAFLASEFATELELALNPKLTSN